MPDTAANEQARHDQGCAFAWGDGVGRADRITDERARQRCWQRYAKLLLRDLDADPDRLAAVGSFCRDRSTAIAAGPQSASRHVQILGRGAELADRALALVTAAGADTDQRARARLLARVERDLYGDPNAGNHWWNHLALAANNSRTRRRFRRLNPLWQIRRRQTRSIRLVHERARTADDSATVTAYRANQTIGRLTYQICVPCRTGLLCKVSVDDDLQGLGIGDRLITETLADACATDGYTWVTTAQNPTARGFWRTVGRRHHVGFTEAEGNRAPCPHMSRSGQESTERRG